MTAQPEPQARDATAAGPASCFSLSSLIPKIAAPQFSGNVVLVPNADQNTAARRLAARIVDLLLRARGALRNAKAPLGERRGEPLAFAGMGRIGAEVAQLIGIVDAVEQHW